MISSSRIKRETEFNIAINAYVGLFAGKEKINGLDKNNFKINSYGLTAPIGIAFSKGHSLFFFDTEKSWSTSLFLSAVDIGALASFRFKDTVTAEIPTVQLKDILSPGLILGFGIPKCPVSINLGAQVGPNLREVNAVDSNNSNPHNDYSNKMYIRYSISFCVDIPLLNLYTKSKN